MKQLTALLSGLLFGVGLIVSGMSSPAKVIAFLDIAGKWDPSLILVMLGAIAVASLLFPLALRNGRTLLGTPLNLPTSTRIDRSLILGSLIFGVGWGMAGYCPGPALVSVLHGGESLMFCSAMGLGMLVEARFSWK